MGEECMTEAKINNLDGAQSKLRALINEIRKCQNINKEKYIENLLEDLTGQAFEAISTQEYYKKWGRHYLPSLVNAHRHQYCNNFKDPGVQSYGSTLFSKLKETGNAVFIGIEPPKKQVYQSPYANFGNGGMGGGHNQNRKKKGLKKQASKVDMNKYYNYHGGCFHGDINVAMHNGTKLVKDLKKGDIVMGGAKIECVVKHECVDNKARLCQYNGLVITPYHPIKVDNKWVFPIDVDQGGQREFVDQFVYNFVLDSGHILKVNGVECCTLAHNFKGPVIEHQYLGTTRIVDDLKKVIGWKEGMVTLQHDSFKRNVDSQLIEGLVGI